MEHTRHKTNSRCSQSAGSYRAGCDSPELLEEALSFVDCIDGGFHGHLALPLEFTEEFDAFIVAFRQTALCELGVQLPKPCGQLKQENTTASDDQYMKDNKGNK